MLRSLEGLAPTLGSAPWEIWPYRAVLSSVHLTGEKLHLQEQDFTDQTDMGGGNDKKNPLSCQKRKAAFFKAVRLLRSVARHWGLEESAWNLLVFTHIKITHLRWKNCRTYW